jgi:NADH-quinone oxidoreductase subunit L
MQNGLAILLPGLPLVGGGLLFAFDIVSGNRSSRRVLLAILPTVLAFVLGVFFLFHVVSRGPTLLSFPALLPGLPEPLAWGVDRLSSIMVLLITGVSAVVQVYSLRYLTGEAGYARFFSLVALETGILLLLVTSRNLLLIFLFWQLMSLGLALLMSHNISRREALKAARKTFLIHRVGDAFFLFGLLLAFRTFHTLDLGTMSRLVGDSSFRAGTGMVTAIVLCLFAGCMAKSAQFPFHVWLPDTMETPTPVSALMHAGIVNVGGYLMNRTSFLFAHSPLTMHVVFLTGFVTALFGSSIMLTQSDVKRKLGFSTMGQMGYMTMECGLGAFSLAVFHLIAHGIFKATLFLESGKGIRIARQDPLLPRRTATDPRTPESFRLSQTLPAALVTLVLPLIILLGAHQLAGIHLSREEGTVIFLFFSWVTVSQVTISLTRARLFDSFYSAIPWTAFLILFVYGYIRAAHGFNLFLYPDPADRALFFASGGVGWILFTPIVLLITGLIIAGWGVTALREIRGEIVLPDWVLAQQERLYLLFLNRGNVEPFVRYHLVVPADRLLSRVLRLLDGRGSP